MCVCVVYIAAMTCANLLIIGPSSTPPPPLIESISVTSQLFITNIKHINFLHSIMSVLYELAREKGESNQTTLQAIQWIYKSTVLAALYIFCLLTCNFICNHCYCDTGSGLSMLVYSIGQEYHKKYFFRYRRMSTSYFKN